MRIRGARIQELLLGLALLAGLLWNVANAAEINDLRLDSGPTGTRAELLLGGQAEFKVISLANPDRLVIDLPGSRLASGFKLPAPAGLVRAVRSGQPEPGVTRLVFDLDSAVVAMGPRMVPSADGARLVVEWPDESGAGGDPIAALIADVSRRDEAPAPPAADPTEASNAATDRLISQMAASSATPAEPVAKPVAAPVAVAPPQPQPDPRPVAATPQPPVVQPVPGPAQPAVAMRPLVIAIDAGHGGQDPGAVGPSGTREKDVTLAIARELGRQIDATPGLKSYLTRDTDVFIPLNHRARLAREAGADMFISVHADAAHNRNAKGSSVYVLSLRGASSQRARWLADKENAADMIGGVRLQETDDTLASVLLDLTQSGQMKASEDAGQHILEGLKRIGNNHKPHIERANFAVLRTSDMPAMLVETAFLSNPEEEKRLIDPQFQRTVARAVLDGVNTYFSNQPPPGTLFAARAMAEAGGQEAAAVSGGSP
ncbi:N-acetylmuramoyl-L-alanine amidase [Luteimonas dalianensis]|uniref:N-acetylmuramoyl-L-alanine amidase n=1 Tax=Luteimonas dalianensis TaxID=1148196 RepID=UPI003BEFD97E